ncbi:hypothetical protein [Gimesia algae]|uniref:Uncharacterized protein n=1 Tax=Gimesia algae TaxID=2527971 RepID=A0A517VH52_9PLAN|nr:hypothetical protein [Gimesia algae]QDT92339.1 hypothetical protein Pan161_40060 [Gimesia algae]
MKKKATRKTAAAKKQTPPKKQAAKKKAVKKKTAKQGSKKKAPKKAVKKKAAPKKTTAKKATTKKSAPRTAVTKKAAKKTPKKQDGADQHPLKEKSTVFASSKTNEWQPYPLLRIVEGDEVLQEKEARREELKAQYKKAELAYELLNKELKLQKARRKNNKGKSFTKQEKDYGDVTGMEIGLRTKYGLLVSPLQYVITVNVSQKKSNDELKQRKIAPLPPAINGTPIKVLEGKFEKVKAADRAILATGSNPGYIPDSGDDVFGGQPIAGKFHPNEFGTLGFVIGGDGEHHLGLSNDHVLKSLRIIRVTSTGPKEIGKVGDQVAEHQTTDGERRFVDAGYIELNLPDDISSIPFVIKDLIEDTSSLKFYVADEIVDDSDLDYPVYKFGARTGSLKEGKLASVKAQVDIEELEDDFLGGIDETKEGIIKIKNEFVSINAAGDSGAAVVMKPIINGKRAWLVIGLIFAQLVDNDRVAYACHISEALKLLKIRDKIPDHMLLSRSQWKNVR